MGQRKTRGLLLGLLALGCAGHIASASSLHVGASAGTASGAPLAAYWQQRVDHVIDMVLDLQQQQWRGSQLVTYTNASPDQLRYLWLRLNPSPGTSDPPIEVAQVLDAAGMTLNTHQLADRLRVDLPTALEPGDSLRFSMEFSLKLPNGALEASTRLYAAVAFYPRLAAYTQTGGWNHQSDHGGRELGDYLVRVTVPDNFLVAGGGELLNPREVLGPRQRDRLDDARQGRHPVVVLGPREARQHAGRSGSQSKTWVFAGEQVRDFAFAALGGYAWEARRSSAQGRPLLMTYYPAQASGWRHQAARALDDAVESWQSVLGEYPWPVATLVLGGPLEQSTMFNIVPVGAGDAEDRWQAEIARAIAGSWLTRLIDPADPWLNEMFEQLADGALYGPGAGEDATAPADSPAEPHKALGVLREAVLGAETFDFALREFVRRWRFLRAGGADFRRSLADASGHSLEWFWPGWQASTAGGLATDPPSKAWSRDSADYSFDAQNGLESTDE